MIFISLVLCQTLQFISYFEHINHNHFKAWKSNILIKGSNVLLHCNWCWILYMKKCINSEWCYLLPEIIYCSLVLQLSRGSSSWPNRGLKNFDAEFQSLLDANLFPVCPYSWKSGVFIRMPVLGSTSPLFSVSLAPWSF